MGLPIIYGTDGSLHPKSRRHLEELHVDVEKLSIRAAFAIAYMAAKANEHLTRLIRRDRPRASHPERPALHLLLTREAPEQKELSSLLTDTGESSEHPAHPTARPARHPAGTAPATAQVHKQQPSGAHQPKNPMNTILTTRQPSREPAAEGQPATRQRRQLHHLRPQQRPYAILRYAGKSPVLSRDPPSPPDGQTERAPREIAGPRRLGTAAQHWKQPVGGANHQRLGFLS